MGVRAGQYYDKRVSTVEMVDLKGSFRRINEMSEIPKKIH